MTKLIPGGAVELYKVNFFGKVTALKFTRMSKVCITEHIQASGDLIRLSFVVWVTVVLLLLWLAGSADQPALKNTSATAKLLSWVFTSQSECPLHTISVMCSVISF